MVVGVGEGARGALGHRGDRYPVRGRIHTPTEAAHWRGGHAAYYGQVGPRLVTGWSGSLAVSRQELLSAGALPTHPSYPPSTLSVWYGSEGLHQAVAPAIGV